MGLIKIQQRRWGDPRDFQILFLTFLLLWQTWQENDPSYWRPLALVFSCLITQMVFIALLKLPIHSLKSAMITGAGLSILLHTDNPLVPIIAGVIAMSSKFLIKIDNKHIFNPGNLAICTTILFTGEAWISPGQWGNSTFLIFAFGAFGFFILYKVDRIDTVISFLGTLFLLEVFRNILYLGWEWDFLFHKFTNGSLLLFSFFMITDPATTPGNRITRIIWSGLVAVCTFLMGQWMQVHTAPIWALFFLSPLTPMLDQFFESKKFNWADAR